jgi:capsular polysaccharide biosynthesis protein
VQPIPASVEKAPANDYVYGGHISVHFGHFIVTTLPRYWPYLKTGIGSRKIVCHGHFGDLERWFTFPFVKEFFGVLGLEIKDFVTFDRPTLLPSIDIPLPSLVEVRHVYKVFSELTHFIGAAILKKSSEYCSKSAAIYLSKTAMQHSFHGAINEQEIVEILAKEQVEIVYPEKLTIYEQISLWRDRQAILGIVGSSFHSSCFYPTKAKIIGVTIRGKVHANCALIDIVNNNDVKYISAECDSVGDWRKEGVVIKDAYRIRDPRGIANTLLELANLRGP